MSACPPFTLTRQTMFKEIFCLKNTFLMARTIPDNPFMVLVCQDFLAIAEDHHAISGCFWGYTQNLNQMTIAAKHVIPSP